MSTQPQATTVPFVKKQQPAFYPFQAEKPLLHSLQRTDSLLIVGGQKLHEWIVNHFELKGTDVKFSASACEAYQTMNETQTDLVISDINLTDESGWLLAAKIQISHPATQVWLNVDRDTAIQKGWGGITFADQLICADKLFQPTLRKCS